MELTVLLWPLSVTILVVVLLMLYKTIRTHFDVTVNCWFCNENAVVPFEHRNGWECTHCEQYNGFTKDGDYNRVIPGMFEEVANGAIQSLSSKKNANVNDKQTADVGHSVLCSVCNQNQQLKIRQLANFVPYNDHNYEIEVEAYSHHLEQVYKLCQVCESKVHLELCQQDAVIRSKMHGAGLLRSETTVNANTSRLTDNDFVEMKQPTDSPQLVCLPHILLHIARVLCALLLTLAVLETSFGSLTAIIPQLSLPLMLTHIFRCIRQFKGLIAAVGMLAQIIFVFVARGERVYVVDVWTCFSWLLTMLVSLWLTGEHFTALMHGSNALHCLLSGLSLILSIYSGCSQQLIELCHVVTPTQTVLHDTTVVAQPRDRNAPAMRPLSQPSFVEGIETMSLGTPSQHRNVGPFGSFANLRSLTSADVSSMAGVDSGTRRRLLVSPAKFIVSPEQQQSVRPLTADVVSPVDYAKRNPLKSKSSPQPDIVADYDRDTNQCHLVAQLCNSKRLIQT